MAELLNDREIQEILGTVIKDGDETRVRPNSYVLRLGSAGEYLTTSKEFHLGEGPRDKKGIKVPPGQSIALTAFETIDSQFQSVTNEYADIRDSITRLEQDVERIGTAQHSLTDQVRQVVREELAQGTVTEQVRKVVREELAQGAVTEQVRKVVRDEQYRWLGGAVSVLIGLGGLGLSAAKSEFMVQMLDSHGDWLGPAITVAAVISIWLLLGRR